MAEPPTPVDKSPEEFPQATPRELHPTSDIRFVIRETATLTERVDTLVKAVDKIGPALEKALEQSSIDAKERASEIKVELKEIGTKVHDLEKLVSTVRGAMWALGGLFAIALVIIGVVANTLLG